MLYISTYVAETIGSITTKRIRNLISCLFTLASLHTCLSAYCSRTSELGSYGSWMLLLLNFTQMSRLLCRHSISYARFGLSPTSTLFFLSLSHPSDRSQRLSVHYKQDWSKSLPFLRCLLKGVKEGGFKIIIASKGRKLFFNGDGRPKFSLY